MDSKFSASTRYQVMFSSALERAAIFRTRSSTKTGLCVGPFGHRFFVRALEKAVEVGAGAALDQADQVLDPDGPLEADGVGDLAPLVMGAGVGDGLRAGAERRHRDDDGEDEIEFAFLQARR